LIFPNCSVKPTGLQTKRLPEPEQSVLSVAKYFFSINPGGGDLVRLATTAMTTPLISITKNN